MAKTKYVLLELTPEEHHKLKLKAAELKKTMKQLLKELIEKIK